MASDRPRCRLCQNPATTILDPPRHWLCDYCTEREQHIHAELAKAREEWEGLLSNWETYAAGVKNLAGRAFDRQAARRNKREKNTRSLEDLLEEPAAQEPDEGHAQVVVNDSILTLPNHIRKIVRLRLNGYTIADIATITNTSARSVDRSLFHAKRLLDD